eukprot:1236753-Pyramimonas_sp.AAC.1
MYCAGYVGWGGGCETGQAASTEAVWGTAGGGGGLRLEQVLRARFLELKMHPGKSREVPNRLRQNETCGLCALEGNRFHVCSM